MNESHRVGLAGLVTLVEGIVMAESQDQKFVGGLEQDEKGKATRPYPVRHEAAQGGEEVVVLRHWKVKWRSPRFCSTT